MEFIGWPGNVIQAFGVQISIKVHQIMGDLFCTPGKMFYYSKKLVVHVPTTQ